jgi:hypothetical protein
MVKVDEKMGLGLRFWVAGPACEADLTHAGGRTGTPAKPPTKPQARDQHQQIRISHIRFHGAYAAVKLYLIFL